MLLVLKHRQKQILKMYLKKLELIKQYCKSDTSLNHYQKQRIIMFIDRCIYFCKTMKFVQYDKTIYKQDGQLIISSIQQYKTYHIIFSMIQNLSNEITADDNLDFKYKVQLSKCLGYLVSHILGKLNHKIVNPYSTLQERNSVDL